MQFCSLICFTSLFVKASFHVYISKKIFIAVLSMLNTMILIIISLLVDFRSFPLWGCFQWHGASF